MTDPMRPHPGGLAGRVADALDDLSLLRQTNADPEAIAVAKARADALIAALNAAKDDDEPNIPRGNN